MKKIIVFIVLILSGIQFQSCHEKPAGNNDIMYTRTKAEGDDRYKNTALENASIKVKNGLELTPEELMQYASHIETRADLYQLLYDNNKADQFPASYNTYEKAGESILTGWLQYPTELDTTPSKIELVKKVTYVADGKNNVFYIYKFKTEEPHWAAKNGWMLGVVGPYFDEYKPYDWTAGTFSRFTEINKTTPEQEAEWSYKNVYKKNPAAN